MLIKREIKGSNDSGRIEWTGEVDLEIDGEGNVKSKTGNIVLCTYSGTWRNGQIDLRWPPHRPRYSGGRVSSHAYR